MMLSDVGSPRQPPSGAFPNRMIPPQIRRQAGHELRAVRVLWQREVIRVLRNRSQAVLMLVNPVLFLLVLGTGLGAMIDSAAEGVDYRTYIFPGVLLMAVQMPALSAGASIVQDREIGFLRSMLVAPVGRGTLLVGKCLGGATAATIQSGLLLALAGLSGLPYDSGLLMLLLGELALIALMLTMVGMLAASFIKRTETFQAVLGLALMPLFFTSGAMFSVRGLPDWLSVLTLVNPLTYAVDALRRTVALELPAGRISSPSWAGWTPSIALELLIMVLFSLAALCFAARRFSR
ncbi:ABC-2 type transport system permease protein [Thermomonospora echinospora]|uniref:Transport permease protein n=1 Tax=Thermomonospora echinospora TaxID=1992 RepID=A0A1H6D1X7_9ACTN|nr:ABC transporter permease [Thermomonospora echinospora]SEG78795.1 ABC-2 type transport system permease protein [Thermomonospora echinospora]